MKTLKAKLNEIKHDIQKHKVELKSVYEIFYFCEPSLNNYTDIMMMQNKYVLEKEKKFDLLFERLCSGEPVQYILGYANFFGHIFKVNESVLIPRMETEELVGNAVREIQEKFSSYNRPIRILELGSGSGVIGISLYLILGHQFELDITFVDIDKEALKVTKTNAKIHDLKNCHYANMDMIEFLIQAKHKGNYDVIISNPPYIDNMKEIDDNVLKYEPKRALLAKPSTYFYEKILEHASDTLNDNALIIFETNYHHQKQIIEFAHNHIEHPIIRSYRDLSGKERNLVIERDLRLVKLIKALNNNGSVIIPSETVFGLGALANELNFTKLCNIKKRDSDHPFSILFKDVEMLKKHCNINKRQEDFLRQVLPGPVTVIVRAKKSAPAYLKNHDNTIGVRISDNKVIEQLFRVINEPLFFTSVNFEGKPPLTTFQTIYPVFKNRVNYIYETYSIFERVNPSTIIRLGDTIELVRRGDTPFEHLHRIWEDIEK